jgi:hypothetical protein
MTQASTPTIGDRHRTAARGRWLALIGIALVVIVAARLPFIANVLIDEEGSLANLVLGTQPVMHGANSLLIGRIDGVDVIGPGGRTPMPYLFLDRVVRPLLGAGDVDGWSMAAISRASRLPFLVVFMIGCLAIAGFAARIAAPLARSTRTAIVLVLTYAMTAPIVVGGSIQPQLDGSIGVLVAALGGVLIAGGRRLGGPLAIACGFAGGVTTGLGKTEWAAALAGAVVTALALRWLWMRWRGLEAPPEARGDTGVLLAALAGVVAALAAVIAFAPPGVADGVNLATMIATTAEYRLTVFQQQLPHAYPLLLLGGLVLVLAFARLDRLLTQHLALVVILIWGFAIGTAYALSGWSGDGFPRYHIPAIALMSLALIGMLATLEPPRWLARAVIAVGAVGLIVNAASLTERAARGLSISSIPGLVLADVEQSLADAARRYRERRQVFFAYASIGVYFRDIEFIAIPVGEEDALRLVRERRPGFTGEFSRP